TDHETAGAPEPCAGYMESGDSDEELDRQIDEALYSPHD
ncbi:hypothetical protein A2U01_0078741, partial [Trifolium medium]|nr:hypothetical protein [Trifolium medium]